MCLLNCVSDLMQIWPINLMLNHTFLNEFHAKLSSNYKSSSSKSRSSRSSSSSASRLASSSCFKRFFQDKLGFWSLKNKISMRFWCFWASTSNFHLPCGCARPPHQRPSSIFPQPDAKASRWPWTKVEISDNYLNIFMKKSMKHWKPLKL